jgi:hypothetical protein
MTEASDPRVAFEVAERGGFIVPNPLVSRGRPVFDSGGPVVRVAGSGAVGLRCALAGESEPWIAVQTGVGPARLLVSWSAGLSEPSFDAVSEGRSSSTPVPNALTSAPASYRIESSANSSRGGDGEWRLEQRVTSNAARSRAHLIEFDGQSWVRLTFEGLTGADSVLLQRFDVHDASNGTDDVWLILGDELATWSIGGACDRASVSELVHARYPGYYPALLDEARVGEAPSRTLRRLEALLHTHATVKHVALAYGAPSLLATDERETLDALVSALLGRDLAVVIARPPLSSGVSRENGGVIHRWIGELETRHGLHPGPDLSQAFVARAAHVADGGLPSSDGLPPPEARAALDDQPTLHEQRALRDLWLEALDARYVPQ